MSNDNERPSPQQQPDTREAIALALTKANYNTSDPETNPYYKGVLAGLDAGQPDELYKAQERVKELEGVIESIIWSVRNEATIGTMIQNILLKANSTIQKHD